ncbi:hypothetical protein MJ579_23335 [Klebsiella pneumoniae]|nr:hypothetical protein MJ579_23335 [Klebsiella pneumoniae]
MMKAKSLFLVTLATQMAAILSQSQLNALFGQYRRNAHSRSAGLFRGGDRRGLDGRPACR